MHSRNQAKHINFTAMQFAEVLVHRAKNPRLFGSVFSGQDTGACDWDTLIDASTSTSLMDVHAIQVEFENLLGISVDVLMPNALPDKFKTQYLLNP